MKEVMGNSLALCLPVCNRSLVKLRNGRFD